MIQKYVLNHSIENDERSMAEAKNLWMFIAHITYLQKHIQVFCGSCNNSKDKKVRSNKNNKRVYKKVRIPLGFANLDKYNFQQLVTK